MNQMILKSKWGVLWLSGFFFFLFLGYLVDPYEQNLRMNLTSPSIEHWLGTDHLGRDLFARLVAGAGYSVFYSLVTLVGAAVLGSILGVVAGWYGGSLEVGILRLVDLTQSFPGLLLAISLSGLLGGGTLPVLFALVLTSWTEFCRMAWSATRLVLQKPYLEAAYLFGFSDFYRIFHYVLREVTPSLLILATLGLGRTLLNFSSLGFLGIGLVPPTPEWGAMIAEGLPYFEEMPWIVLAPTIAIASTVLFFYFEGQRLKRVLQGEKRS